MQLDYGSPPPPAIQVSSRGHQRSTSSSGGVNQMSYSNLVASTSTSNSRTRHSSLPGVPMKPRNGPAPAFAPRALAASTSGTSNSVSTFLSDKGSAATSVHRNGSPPRSQTVNENAGLRILDELLQDMLEIIEADDEQEQDDDARREDLDEGSLSDGSSSDDSDSGDEENDMEQSTSTRREAGGASATGGEVEMPPIDKPVEKEREEGELDSEMDVDEAMAIDEVDEENANTTLREGDAKKVENDEAKARKQRWRVESCISERDVYKYLRRRGFSKDLLGTFKRECVSKGKAASSDSREDRPAFSPAAPEPIPQSINALSTRSDGDTSVAVENAESTEKATTNTEDSFQQTQPEADSVGETAKERTLPETDVAPSNEGSTKATISTSNHSTAPASEIAETQAKAPLLQSIVDAPADVPASPKSVPVPSSAQDKAEEEISYKQLSTLHSIKHLIRKAEQWESSKLSVSKLLEACLKLAAQAPVPPPSTTLERVPERRERVDRGVSPPLFARQISIPLRRPSSDATARPAHSSAGAAFSATVDRNRLPTPTSPTRVASSNGLPLPAAPSASSSAQANGVNGIPNGRHASPPPSSLREADPGERLPAPTAEQSVAQREHAQRALALAAKFEQALNSKHLIFTRADLARLAPASASTSNSAAPRRNAQPTLAQSISVNGTRAPATTTNARSESVREISPPTSRPTASTSAAAAVSASASASPAVNGDANAGRAFLGSSTRLKANAQYASPSAPAEASPVLPSAAPTAVPARDAPAVLTAAVQETKTTADVQAVNRTAAPGDMAIDTPSASAPVEKVRQHGQQSAKGADMPAVNTVPATVSAANDAIDNDVSMDVGDDYPPAAIDATTGADNAVEASHASKSPPPHVSPPISTTSTTQLVAPRQSAESIKAMFLGKKPTALPKRQAQASDFSGSNDVIAVAAKQGPASVDPRRAAAAAAARAKLLREKESAASASASASASPPLPPPLTTAGTSTTGASMAAPQARAASPMATITASAEMPADGTDMSPQENAAGKYLPKHPLPAKPSAPKTQKTSTASTNPPASLPKIPGTSVDNTASAARSNEAPEEGEIELTTNADISPAVASAISGIKESRETELKNRLKRQREQASEQSRKKRSIPTVDDGSASDASTSSKKASAPSAPVPNTSASTRRLVNAGGRRISEVLRNHDVDSDTDEDEAVEVTATKATTTATKSITLPAVEVTAKSSTPSRSSSAIKDGPAQPVEKEAAPKKHKSGTVVARKSTGGFKKKAPVSAPATTTTPASESVKVKLKLGGTKDGKAAETPTSSAAKSTKKIPPAATIIDITDSSDDDDLVANTTVASKKASPSTLNSSSSKPRPKARPYVGSSKQLADQSMSIEAESDSRSSSTTSAIPPDKNKPSADVANKDLIGAPASKEGASAAATQKDPAAKDPRPPLRAPLQAPGVTSTSTPTPKPRAAEQTQAPSMLDGKPLSSPPMRARDSASPLPESLNNGVDASDNESGGYSPSRMPRDTASPPPVQPVPAASTVTNGTNADDGTNADEEIDELAATSPVVSKAMQIASSQSPEANMLRGLSETGSDFGGGEDVDMLADETQGNKLANQLLADIVSELPDIPRAQSATSVSKRSKAVNRSAERAFMDPMDLSLAFGSDEEDGEGSSISESGLINNTSLSGKGAPGVGALTADVTSTAPQKGPPRATASDFMLPTASTSASEQVTAVSAPMGTTAVPREASPAPSATVPNSKTGDVAASPAAPSEADSVEVIMSGQSPPKPFVPSSAEPGQSASRDGASARATNIASLDALDRPLEDTFTRCKFATGCLNINCSFAHPSPFLSAIKSRTSDLPKLGSQCMHVLQCQNEAARRKELCVNQATCPLGAKCAYRHADNVPAQHANRSWHSKLQARCVDGTQLTQVVSGANQSARFESPSSSAAGGRTGSPFYAQHIMPAPAAGSRSSSPSASPATVAAKQPLQQIPAASTSAAVASTSNISQQEQALMDTPPSMRAYHQQQAALSKSTSWVAGLSNSGPMGWLAKATGFQNPDSSKKP